MPAARVMVAYVRLTVPTYVRMYNVRDGHQTGTHCDGVTIQ
jgi:hypothetical protein